MRRLLLIAPVVLTCCVDLNSSPGIIEPVADGNVVTNPNSHAADGNTPVKPQQPEADPNHPTNGPTVRFMGRFDMADPNNPVFSFSGSTIITRFMGSSLDIKLSEDQNQTYAGVAVDNYYDVFIDGALTGSFSAMHGVNAYRITPAGLSYGDHIVWVVKRTEAQIGEATFSGFVAIDGNMLPAPQARNRRIEYIGDSITCGYGDMADVSSTNMCAFSDNTENADLSYAWLTGQALGADTMQVSFSGKGVVQNVDPTDDPYYTMPILYPFTNPTNHDVLWDFNSWTPDVVVIVLGGNDYQGVNTNSNVPAPSDATFIAGYQGLIKQVRGHYPNATIICGLGPMLYGNALSMALTNIQTAVSTLQAAGDSKLSFIEFPPDAAPFPAGYGTEFGCDYHPDSTTQRAMSALLVTQIKAKMNW